MRLTWEGRKGIGCYANKNVSWKCAEYPFPVRHCMHPTANYPWFTHSPEGDLRTFRLLKQAKEYVEDLVAEREGGDK